MNTYSRKSSWSTVLAAALSALLAAPLFAHHSFAVFDQTITRTLHGTVKSYQQVNPHGYLQVLVTTSSGKVQEWSIECSAVLAMEKFHINQDTFKAGDAVTVTIHPLRNGTTGGQFLYITLPDGTILGDKPAAPAAK